MLFPADIKAISVMGSCPASPICGNGRGTVGRRWPAARFDRCFVALQFTSGNGLQFKPFPATDEDLSHAVDAGPLDEKRRI